MAYYMIPRTHLSYSNIEYAESNRKPTNIILQSLSNHLFHHKEKITSNESLWDVYKKYTNPFEYIHTVIPVKKRPVSKYKPLSRSYFKMIEIIKTFQIFFKSPITSFHLAEGPGGFIEALLNIRNCPEDRYYGMTLLSDKKDTSVPGWNKSDAFLREHPNVIIEKGYDKTGNILCATGFEYIISTYSNRMDFITADGGFDFSSDFNNQEIYIGKLLFAQVAYAICLQKYRGSFVLKIFDCFMQHTVDILFILSAFYEKVYIMKPHTSRYANSERYIVCSGFIHKTNRDFYPHFLKCFREMMRTPDTYPFRFLNVGIPKLFIKKIEDYISILGKKQLQNIQYTLSFIENKPKNDKIEQMIRENIAKCIDWCVRFNVPFHEINTNIFLQKDL
jgi:23S rRNA U2552 (ribose-2'-O)-methylase RlmE/FtsJ